jgi:thioredoxin 1
MVDKFKELINDEKPVLIDFYATWCGPCQAMAPVLESVKQEMGETARVVKIDVDKFQQIAGMYQISSVPTMMIFKKGEMLWRHSGTAPKGQLVKLLQENA